MKCPKCGKKIVYDSVFCEYCGTKIDTVDDQEIKKNRKKFLKVLVSTLIGLLALYLLFVIAVHAFTYYQEIIDREAQFRIGNPHAYTETAFDVNMKMIWVEGGDFLMGCTSEQGNCDSNEQNVRRVTVDGFYIGMLEVTQSQWEKVMGTSIYQQKSKTVYDRTYGVGPDYPMYYVSWDEATEFCRLLSNKTGRTYTLPTEAQWEYAARGGKKADGTKYAGSNMVDAVAWYDGNSGYSTHVCGSKRANALGIYDMSGNVWEWCKDWYASSYVSYDTNNPTGPSSGSYRVYRGGSWNYNASYCRVANRSCNTPSDRGINFGFRVVLLP